MANIGYNYLIFSIEKLVIFEIRRHKNVGPGGYRIPQKKASRASANGNRFDHRFGWMRITNCPAVECFFQKMQKLHNLHPAFQCSDHPASDVRIGVCKPDHIVSDFFIRMGRFHCFYNVVFPPKGKNYFYFYFLFPVLLGTGKRLFGSGTAPAALKVVESVTTSKGGTYLRLTRAGKPEYGTMGSE